MAAVQFWPCSPSTPSHCSLSSHSKELVVSATRLCGKLLLARSSEDTIPGSSRSARPPEGSRALEKLISYTSKGADTSIAVQKLDSEGSRPLIPQKAREQEQLSLGLFLSMAAHTGQTLQLQPCTPVHQPPSPVIQGRFRRKDPVSKATAWHLATQCHGCHPRESKVSFKHYSITASLDRAD